MNSTRQRASLIKIFSCVLFFILCACGVKGIGFEDSHKSYLDELEEAYVAKIAHRRAERRLRRGSISIKNGSIGRVKMVAEKGQISEKAAASIKSILKDSFLTLLASSELISWSDLKDRVIKAKKALNVFEEKYKEEFTSAGKIKEEKVKIKKDAEKDAEDEEDEDEEDEEVAKTGMPGVEKITGMPGVPAVVISKPVVVKPGMPGVSKPTGMPGMISPVTPKPVSVKPGISGIPRQVVRVPIIPKPITTGPKPVKVFPKPVVGGMPVA